MIIVNKEELWLSIVKDRFIDVYNHEEGMYTIYNGCKVTNVKGRIRFYNCNTGADSFAELSDRQMELFYKHGFHAGVELLKLDNCRTEVMLLDIQILRAEKQSETLKLKKRRTLLQNQINQIKSNYYGNKKINI